jgi:hypothetical protein
MLVEKKKANKAFSTPLINIFHGMGSVLEIFPSEEIEIYSDRNKRNFDMFCNKMIEYISLEFDIDEEELLSEIYNKLCVNYNDTLDDWLETRNLLTEAYEDEKRHCEEAR